MVKPTLFKQMCPINYKCVCMCVCVCACMHVSVSVCVCVLFCFFGGWSIDGIFFKLPVYIFPCFIYFVSTIKHHLTSFQDSFNNLIIWCLCSSILLD